MLVLVSSICTAERRASITALVCSAQLVIRQPASEAGCYRDATGPVETSSSHAQDGRVGAEELLVFDEAPDVSARL